jgi:hypothetical protein
VSVPFRRKTPISRNAANGFYKDRFFCDQKLARR